MTTTSKSAESIEQVALFRYKQHRHAVYDANDSRTAVLSRATHYYKTDGQSARLVGHKLTELVDYHIMTLMVTVAS
jgi:hypothetical protein